MNLQTYIDGLYEQAKKERASTQMTLGELITALEELPDDTEIKGLSYSFCSYRGYYSDLAIEKGISCATAGTLLTACNEIMGQELTGYKGGEYMMGVSTPVWVADYGETGDKLMAVNTDGSIETEEE